MDISMRMVSRKQSWRKTRSISRLFFVLLLTMAFSSIALPPVGGARTRAALQEEPESKINKINHIIVIYQENWSFDSLYGKFPGANGLANASSTIPQVDKSGAALSVLPQPINNNVSPAVPDSRFPATMPVAPYDLSQFVAPDQITGDIIHRFYHEQLQIDGGKLDKFVTWSDNGGLVFSYFDASNMPEGKLAKKYVMCDNLFHSAFGGSFLNHIFFIAAAPPAWPNAPSDAISNPDPANLNDARVTPDGFAVNTSFTINQPHPASVSDPAELVPEQTMPTIGDRLNDKGITWKWYSGGWNNALAGHADPLFQFHHQPFAYFQNYADGTAARAAHLQDEQNFFSDLTNGTLPAVSFIKPLGPDNEHPGYANELRGQQHVADIVNAVKSSQFWQDCAIIVTYDENGGRWDHVPPPTIDRWGPGTRVPGIVISPFARKHTVDSTQYETVSILKFIENRFGLAPLSQRDANANDLSNAFR